MQIQEIYQKLRDFAMAATGYASSKVVVANQVSNARPKKPFITIDIKNFRNVGTPIMQILDNTGKQTLVVSMMCTASFNTYSDKEHEAEDVLETLHIKLSSELENDIFKGELAPRNVLLKTTALPKSMNEQFESRGLLEVEMGFNKTTEYQGYLIETVIVDPLVNEYSEQLTIEKGV